MDVLVLGGTSFVGRWIVQDLLDRGHTPTLFTRGVTGGDLFPGVARVVGDRSTGDYSGLTGSWDAVVDVSAYVPRNVTEATDALRGKVSRYLFISTVSVYQVTPDASGELPRYAPYRESEEVTGETYGPLKVACEDDVLSLWGDQATIVRPGIVAGPYDPTDRFTYWARRAAKGGRIATPARVDAPAQVVDARDLARLVTVLLEGDTGGNYDAVGIRVTLRELINTCAAGSSHELVPVTGEDSFPLMLPEAPWDVLFQRDPAAAIAAGMPVTPLATTAHDTLVWDQGRGEPTLGAGPPPEREIELLEG